MSLKIVRRTIEGVAVFELDGSLDTLTVEQLEPEVLDVLDSGAERILFDMAGVKYVTSTGLRVFILVNRRLQGKGRMAFANLQPVVAQIFDVLHLSIRHEIYASVDEALRSLGESEGTALPIPGVTAPRPLGSGGETPAC